MTIRLTHRNRESHMPFITPLEIAGDDEQHLTPEQVAAILADRAEKLAQSYADASESSAASVQPRAPSLCGRASPPHGDPTSDESDAAPRRAFYVRRRHPGAGRDTRRA